MLASSPGVEALDPISGGPDFGGATGGTPVDGARGGRGPDGGEAGGAPLGVAGHSRRCLRVPSAGT
eukprot:16647-Pyramimonas_sp.AAC.1